MRDAATRELLPYLIRWRRGRARAYTGRRAVLELVTVLGWRRGQRLYRHATALGLATLPRRATPDQT